MQAEDELASIGMVIGAAWNGARAFTATSGPGISLMQEFLGLAYFAEIPAVLFDVQRGSPSTGMPTRTQQADLAVVRLRVARRHEARAAAARGSARMLRVRALAFDLADRLQTPVFVMLDLDIGMQDWLTEPLAWDDSRRMDRGKVMTRSRSRRRPRFRPLSRRRRRRHSVSHVSRARIATKGSYFTRGTTKDRYARYTEEGPAYVDNMQRLLRKFETAKALRARSR